MLGTLGIPIIPSKEGGTLGISRITMISKEGTTGILMIPKKEQQEPHHSQKANPTKACESFFGSQLNLLSQQRYAYHQLCGAYALGSLP